MKVPPVEICCTATFAQSFLKQFVVQHRTDGKSVTLLKVKMSKF